MSNNEVLEYLKSTDVADLKEYLRTGKSPKYDDEEILGIWHLDKDAVLTYMRKANPDIKSRELRALKAALEAVPQISFIAMPDKTAVVKVGSAAPEEMEEATPAEEAEPDPMDRYRQFTQQQPVQAPAPAQPSPPPIIPQISGQGTWDEQAGQYVVAMNASGRDIKGTARITADEMVLTFPGANLVFIKQ